jgi:hypothetical protein
MRESSSGGFSTKEAWASRSRTPSIELAKDGYGTVDAINCLRAGIVEPAEWENGHWRYRVRTTKLLVVIQFEDEEELLVVTAWKLRT